MATKEQKLITLVNTLGFDEAMRLAPSLTDDAAGSGDDAAAKAAEAESKAAKEASSKNPFVRGPHFSLAEQSRLYKDPKTRSLAISLAKSAGVTLPDTPRPQDLNARALNG